MTMTPAGLDTVERACRMAYGRAADDCADHEVRQVVDALEHMVIDRKATLLELEEATGGPGMPKVYPAWVALGEWIDDAPMPLRALWLRLGVEQGWLQNYKWAVRVRREIFG